LLDCSILISGSHDKSALIFDMKAKNNKPIQILEDSKDSIESIDISLYEILTSSIDGYVRIYDIRKGKLYVDKISESISFSKFSVDKKTYSISSLNSKIYLIDNNDGNLLNTYSSHENKNYKIKSTFSNDDKCNSLQ
jgi:mitogen-activated protein kinase organizer 1